MVHPHRSTKIDLGAVRGWLDWCWSDEIRYDPLKFVLGAYPWGKSGSPLSNKVGPRTWQERLFGDLGDHLKRNKNSEKLGVSKRVFKAAISSGRGIGKSAEIGMGSDWFLNCVVGGTGIITSNTEDQLRSRTMPEIKKWFTLSRGSFLWDQSVLSIVPKKWYADLLSDKGQLNIDPSYYYIRGQTWSAEKPDSFAGAHSHHGIFLVMDESSGIIEKIYNVSEGFFTELTDFRIWFSFGNNRRVTGPFARIFMPGGGTDWNKRRIDSRTVEDVDLKLFESMVARYGEDSDMVRVEARGLPPRGTLSSFISPGDVEEAAKRTVVVDSMAPLIMGIDIARGGSDATVIVFRRGRSCSEIGPFFWRGDETADSMEVVRKIGQLITKYDPDGVYVDGVGPGGPIVDALKRNRYKVSEVWGSWASRDRRYGNLRICLWEDMREWLKTGSIPDEQELKEEFCLVESKTMGQTEKLILESKDDIRKKNNGRSPDFCDALSYTFYQIPRFRGHGGAQQPPKIAKDVDYNPFSY